MSNFLQSKGAVAFLVVSAVGMIAYQSNLFVGPNVHLVVGRQAEVDESVESEENEPMVTNTPPRYLAGLRDWQKTISKTPPGRDPFLPLLTNATTNSLAPFMGPMGKRALSFSLQAISHHNQRRFAVIDGVILGEGDRLADFQVVQIDRQSVLLRGQEGVERRLQLEFSNEPARESESQATDSTPSRIVPQDPDPK